jgi:hypothetical protein
MWFVPTWGASTSLVPLAITSDLLISSSSFLVFFVFPYPFNRHQRSCCRTFPVLLDPLIILGVIPFLGFFQRGIRLIGMQFPKIEVYFLNSPEKTVAAPAGDIRHRRILQYGLTGLSFYVF